MSDYTPGKAHEDLVELIWAHMPGWDYPTDVDRLAEAIDRYFLPKHGAKVLEDWARERQRIIAEMDHDPASSGEYWKGAEDAAQTVLASALARAAAIRGEVAE